VRKDLCPTAENVSDFKEHELFLENFTTKVVVFVEVFREYRIKY